MMRSGDDDLLSSKVFCPPDEVTRLKHQHQNIVSRLQRGTGTLEDTSSRMYDVWVTYNLKESLTP